MLDFFKKIFRKRKPAAKSAQVSQSTRVSNAEQGSRPTRAKHVTRTERWTGWWKQVTEVIKERGKPRFPRIVWGDRFSPRQRAGIIAAAAGTVLGVWLGIHYYQPPPPMHGLSIETNPVDGGSVSASVGGAISPVRGNYRDGSPVMLTATPSEGYQFDSWSGDASGTSPKVTITMDGDKNITANFDTISYTLSTSVNPTGGGTINAESGSYQPGSTIDLVATASPGYEFRGWSGDVYGTSPEVTVTMDSDKSITASFSIVRYTLEVSASPPEGGTVSTGGVYPPGSPVDLVATPAPGYEFLGWSGDVSGT
ncbi:MAG: InlB B-repeat-containing protein, partial [Dehalococcoidales bacterium]|nr:InlB B-repeat-containing protein [Dehalococcoidales bacterium]